MIHLPLQLLANLSATRTTAPAELGRNPFESSSSSPLSSGGLLGSPVRLRLASRRSGFKDPGVSNQRHKSLRYEPFPRRSSTHKLLSAGNEGQGMEREMLIRRRQSGSHAQTRERSGPFILPIPSPGPAPPDDYVRSPMPRYQRNSRRRSSRKKPSPNEEFFHHSATALAKNNSGSIATARRLPSAAISSRSRRASRVFTRRQGQESESTLESTPTPPKALMEQFSLCKISSIPDHEEAPAL